jgi:hypothetical protein
VDANLVSPLFVGRHDELASVSVARSRAIAGEAGFVLTGAKLGTSTATGTIVNDD